MRARILMAVAMTVFSLSSLAQTTATIQGKVVTPENDPLPGVTVTIESNKMLGSQSDVTRGNGEFLFRRIPPGKYTITSTMVGMNTDKTSVTCGLGTIQRPVITLTPGATAEEMVVTMAVDPVLETTEIISHFEAEFFDKLAVGRTQGAVALMTPGVTNKGGTGTAAVMGANNGANTWLVNGADARFDNIRSQPGNVIIEDSVQETTVMVAAISAEYGQFGGGVINTITKSGGNHFTGSYRAALRNLAWEARTPLELESGALSEKEDKINYIHTATFGGPIIKDRLWFFLAAETTEEDVDSNYTSPPPMSDRAAESYGLPTGQIGLPQQQIPGRVNEEMKLDFKLTGSISEGHTLTASWVERNEKQINYPYSSIDDTANCSREIPRTQRALTYNGIITPEVGLELQWSDRESVFEERPYPPHLQEQIDAGADVRVVGTLIRFYARSPRACTNSPYFLGKPDEPRASDSLRGVVNYFLTSEKLGSHDFAIGFQSTEDTRYADNRQTVNDWQFRCDMRFEVGPNGERIAIPIFSPTSSGGRYQTRLIYYPVEIPSMTQNFKEDSLFINDAWSLDDHWRFNIGFRYDKNKGIRSDDVLSADDDILSPRISLNYDLKGDGKHEFNASYCVYAQRIGDAADDGSQAGGVSFTDLRYTGPQTENYLDVIAWINDRYGEGFFEDPLNHPNSAAWEADLRSNNLSHGVLDSPGQVFGQVDYVNGGYIPGGLTSPNTVESRIGYSTRFGSKGYFKVDYVHRDFEDFYVDNTSLVTGPTNNGNDDLNVINNDDSQFWKQYDAILCSGSWKFSENLFLYGNYTWSQLRGNQNDTDETSGIITTINDTTFFEFKDFPGGALVEGYLRGGQRHVLNLVGLYTLNTQFGTFDFALSERYEDGSPYGISFTIEDDYYEDYGIPARGSVGYVSAPSSVTYTVSRDCYRTEDMYATDLGFTWTYRIKKADLFVEIDLRNIFNASSANRGWSLNTNVYPYEDNPFNVHTETPELGVHYYLDEGFGTPDSTPDFQNPRELLIDLGVKF